MSNNKETSLFAEEADHLVRITKKHKATSQSFTPQRPTISYKDLVLRPSLDWEDHIAHGLPINDEDPHSNIELDSDDSFPTILLSKEEKQCTRAPWRSNIIVKAFNKSLGFKYFDHKI
nr:hypothetical protein CFP56_66039 [Quercus suber]